MKNTIYFVLTCFISTGALLGATKAPNPWPYFAVMLIIWLLFAWRVSTRSKRSRAKSEREFRNEMRSKFNR